MINQPKYNLVEELRRRGMLQDITPGAEEFLAKNSSVAYIGFDPTAQSLHIGNLATIMLLVHVQKAGHKPIALVGGATGMVGDPSGKSAERNMLDEKTLERNVQAIKAQLEKFLDFNAGEISAEVVNNYDWFKEFSFLGFLRKVGKHLTVNYMMAKDSVKKRLETGISFTEFSYQLLQGYDYYHLFKEKKVRLQLGGSDQWGNITTGTELIRRLGETEEAYAITTPLVTKADGTKFGKSESGNVWLDPAMTSPYKFYQFFLNVADDEATKLIRVYTLLPVEIIEALEAEHNTAPHLRVLQKELAKNLTITVHGKEEYEKAVAASEILFGKADADALLKLDAATLNEVFDGVPQVTISTEDLMADIISFLAVNTQGVVLPSKSEARKMLEAGAISINGIKVDLETSLTTLPLIADKYLLIKKGKKNYYLAQLS